jgi:hypothetical protein
MGRERLMCRGCGAPRSEVRKEDMVVGDDDDDDDGEEEDSEDCRFVRSVLRICRSFGEGCPFGTLLVSF